MYGEGLLKQFLDVGFEEGDDRVVYDGELKFQDEPWNGHNILFRVSGLKPFPRLSTTRYGYIYPFPGYDLRLGRGIRLAVSLRRTDYRYRPTYYYPSWLVAPPPDGGHWEPVHEEDENGYYRHARLKSRIMTLCLMLDKHSGKIPASEYEQSYFMVKATVYQKILRDTKSGAGLYAKVNLLSKGIQRKVEWISGNALTWGPLPVVERWKDALDEFKRMVRLAELATRRDEVFLSGEVSPTDCPFLIAASEDQLPRYRNGKFARGRLSVSVVLDYGRLIVDKLSHPRPFMVPEQELWEGVVRCFPNESVLVEISA